MSTKHFRAALLASTIAAISLTGCQQATEDGAGAVTKAPVAAQTAPAAVPAQTQVPAASGEAVIEQPATVEAVDAVSHGSGAQAPAAKNGRVTQVTPVQTAQAMTETQARAALQRLAPGQSFTVVRVGTGWQGATADSSQTITFWTGTSKWTKAGTSTFPESLDRKTPLLQSRLLTGMPNAVFIATGEFTGNGTGNAVAFARNGSWSVLQEKSDDLAPFGNGGSRSTGLFLAIDFTTSGLRTSSMWGPEATASFAAQKDRPIIRTYQGNDWALTGVGDNFVEGLVTNAADLPNLQDLPASGTIADGNYSASTARLQSDGLHLGLFGGGSRILPVSGSYTGEFAAFDNTVRSRLPRRRGSWTSTSPASAPTRRSAVRTVRSRPSRSGSMATSRSRSRAVPSLSCACARATNAYVAARLRADRRGGSVEAPTPFVVRRSRWSGGDRDDRRRVARVQPRPLGQRPCCRGEQVDPGRQRQEDHREDRAERQSGQQARRTSHRLGDLGRRAVGEDRCGRRTASETEGTPGHPSDGGHHDHKHEHVRPSTRQQMLTERDPEQLLSEQGVGVAADRGRREQAIDRRHDRDLEQDRQTPDLAVARGSKSHAYQRM